MLQSCYGEGTTPTRLQGGSIPFVVRHTETLQRKGEQALVAVYNCRTMYVMTGHCMNGEHIEQV